MTQITLKIADLKPSSSNVRTKHDRKDVLMMADSLRMRGLINPPSVAKNGDGRYEVVAGLLRYRGAIEAGWDEMLCDDVSALTEAERIDISFSENLHRRGMSEVQQYRAYNKLFKVGMSIEDIAKRFGNTVRGVEQRLAIGGLPKKILDLYDNDEIGARAVQALALAPHAMVVKYGKLAAKDRPRDWDINQWLDGDKGRYLAKNALFDVDVYEGPKITDLFAEEDEVWLTCACKTCASNQMFKTTRTEAGRLPSLIVGSHGVTRRQPRPKVVKSSGASIPVPQKCRTT